MTTAKITLGPGAIRVVSGSTRRTVLRHQIIGLDRIGDRAILAFWGVDADDTTQTTVLHAEFEDSQEAQAIEDWLLDAAPGVLVPAEAAKAAVEPTVKPGQEIGPGSIVEYLGQVYEVSREAHDGEIRKWRLAGYMSRGVNESALRLVTPIRKGDRVIFEGNLATGVVIGPGSPGTSGEINFPVRVDDGEHEDRWFDREILHASRDTDDGVIVVR